MGVKPLWEVLLAGWIGAAAYVHVRGRERLSFMRQLADHSTFAAPYNVFVYLCSAVPRRPILDVASFPELEPLREHWEVIRDEALALYRSGDIKAAVGHDDLAFNSFFKKDWRRFYLTWYGAPLPSARRLCPRTLALVERIPAIHAAMFAVLAPHSRLVRHRDPFAGSLRYHLGLAIPPGGACRILVDGEPYVWREGEAVVFDETYIHKAENRTDAPRIILFCDVERPLRSRAATRLNRFVIRHVMGVTATANEEGEYVGAANRVFRQLYRVRLAMKQVKRRNRTAYRVLSYGAKIGVSLGLLWLVLA